MIMQILAAILFYGSIWAVWLIPLVPATIFEVRTSGSLLKAAAAAGVLIWSASMLMYYSAYLVHLAFIGAPNMEHLLYSNRFSPGYWQGWVDVFRYVILGQFLEWIWAAIILRAAVDWLSARIYRAIRVRRMKTTSVDEQSA